MNRTTQNRPLLSETRVRSTAASVAPRPASVAATQFARSACACGGGCPRCRKQSALTVGAETNSQERVADRTVDAVMRMPSPATPPAVASANEIGGARAPAVVDEVLASPGKPLDTSTRRFMESRLRQDFGDVRVHSDARAAQSSRALHAQAYTVGHHVAFARDRYAPRDPAGRCLLAHELTHVMQQRGAAQRQVQRAPAALAASRPPFDDQPEAFRRVLASSLGAHPVTFGCRAGTDAAECFNGMDAKLRLVLIGVQQRLASAGLWGHVTAIDNVWTSGVGGAGMSVDDARGFFADVLASGRYCRDSRLGALLHPGATSMREISTGDGLHLAIGPGAHFSAHIDNISPASGREADGTCHYDPVATQAHLGREVVPLAIPGLQIFPEPRPSFGPGLRGPDGRDSPPPDIIRWTIPIPGT